MFFGFHQGLGRLGGVSGPVVADLMFIGTGSGDTGTKGHAYKCEITGGATMISKTLIYSTPNTNAEVVGISGDATNNYVFMVIDDPTGGDKIIRTDLDGGNETDITPSGGFFTNSKQPNGIACDPVNEYIFYGSSQTGNAMRADYDGGNETSITPTGSQPASPSINPESPSGGEIAYVVTSGGVRAVTIEKFDGTFVNTSPNAFFNGDSGLIDDTWFYGVGNTANLQAIDRSTELVYRNTTNGITGTIMGMTWHGLWNNENIYFVHNSGGEISYIDKDYIAAAAVTDIILDGVTYPTDMIDISLDRFTI